MWSLSLQTVLHMLSLTPVKSSTEIKCVKVVTGVTVGKTEARLN